MQGCGDAGRRAVRVGHDVSAALAVGGLVLHGIELAGVDLGDDDRDVGIHPVGSGVREHGDTGLRQFGLGRSGEVRGYAAECDSAVLGDLLDVHGLDPAVHGLVQIDVVPDLQDVAEPLALRPLGCVEPLDLEPGVVLQHLDEPLADHTGRSKHGYADLAHWNGSLIVRAIPARIYDVVDGRHLQVLPSAMSYQRSDSPMSTSTPSPVRYMLPRRIWAPLCLLSAADVSHLTASSGSLSTPAPVL